MKNLILFVAATALITSCIPYNKFQKTKSENESLQKRNYLLDSNLKAVKDENTIMYDSIKLLEKKMDALSLDTMICQNSLRKMANNYDQINKTYELLIKEKRLLLEGNENDKKELEKKLKETLKTLNKTTEDLEKTTKEIELKKSELNNLLTNLKNTQEELLKNQKELEENRKELEKSRKEVEQKDKNLMALQDILNRQDSMVKLLKSNVSKALLGFENNGLTIQVKNSKVYVSLDENLLFASGSTVVDKKGEEALNKLSKMLEQNPDINIMIEGHTDDVPYKGKNEIKDNWDLSAMRATSVAKILLKNSKIQSRRITVAGRGEFFPVDDAKTPQARQKNRRTEIILTPKLDELFNIMNNN